MIRLENVSAGYGGDNVLHGINMTVPQGDFLAIVGPNGCGKSTLLKTMAGLNSHYTGKITIQGKLLEQWPRMELSRIMALLPQGREIPTMDVRTLVAHGRFPYCGFLRRLSEEDHKQIQNALVTMGILHLRHTNIRELSGGERQKAFLAMMLAQDAGLLLLDEPTTYLDAGFQLEILDCLKHLNQQGKTIIIVLHDLNHAFNLSQNVALLDQGRLVLLDSPAGLIKSQKVDQVFGVQTKILTENDKKYYVFEMPDKKPATIKEVKSECKRTRMI